MPCAKSARDRKEDRYHRAPREAEIIVHASALRQLWSKDKEMLELLFKIQIFDRRNWENVGETDKLDTHSLRWTYSSGMNLISCDALVVLWTDDRYLSNWLRNCLFLWTPMFITVLIKSFHWTTFRDTIPSISLLHIYFYNIYSNIFLQSTALSLQIYSLCQCGHKPQILSSLQIAEDNIINTIPFVLFNSWPSRITEKISMRYRKESMWASKDNKMTDLATFSCKSWYKAVRLSLLRLEFSKW